MYMMATLVILWARINEEVKRKHIANNNNNILTALTYNRLVKD